MQRERGRERGEREGGEREGERREREEICIASALH
jgi:hypothetical protein